MANPTTAKPATSVWDSTGYPNLQWMTPLTEASGCPVDVVGVFPARCYDSYTGVCCGASPIITTATFGGVTSQRTYKWGLGNRSLLWHKRAWAAGATVATNRTFAIVLRHNFLSGQNAYPATITLPILAVGADGNAIGLALSISTNGVVTWGFWRSSAMFSSAQVLTAGTWYALALTCTSATARLFNLYDYGAQSATAQSPLTDTSSYANNFGTDDNSPVLIQPQATASYSGALVEVFSALLDNATWDTGANSNFLNFYTDPCAAARGTYTPSGGLTAGVASLHEATSTAIILTAAHPTGGTPAGNLLSAYTYQWYRDTSGPTFTLGAGNILAGATSATLSDTTALPGQIYFYRCRQGDGSTTVDTNGPAGVLNRGALTLGFIGDSETGAGSFAPPGFLAAAVATGWRVGSQNRGIGATFVGTPTNSTGTQSWKAGVFTLGTSIAGTAGTFTLAVTNGQGTQTTGTIAWNASAATMQTALQLLSNVGANGVVIGAGSFGGTSTTFAFVFTGAALPSPASGLTMTVNNAGLTGGPYFAYSNYLNAVLALLGDPQTITNLYIHLGTNDNGILASSAATFQADLTLLVNALLAEGFARVWLNAPLYRWLGATGAGTSADLNLQYQASVAAICNGTTIVQADQSYLDSARAQGILHDGLHAGQGGFWGLGFRQWLSVAKILDPAAIGVGGGGGGRLRIGL